MKSLQFCPPEKSSATVRWFLPIVAFVLAVFSLQAPAQAGDSFNFRGLTAVAEFSNTDGSGCVFTDAFIFASNGRLHDPPGPGTPSPVAEVNIFQYDSCSGTQLLAAFGSSSLTADSLQVDKKLTSATLNATVQVFDYISGNTFNEDIALNWTSTGDPVSEKDHFQFRAPGYIANYRFSGTSRPAQASGSVSDGVTNFSPGPSYYAEIDSVKSGSVTIN
jgi:hypothetical protein